MLYKFTEVKTYYIEAETEQDALDKYSELHHAEVSFETVAFTSEPPVLLI